MWPSYHDSWQDHLVMQYYSSAVEDLLNWMLTLYALYICSTITINDFKTYVYFFFDTALILFVRPFGFSRFCIERIAGWGEACLSGLFALFPLRPNFGLWTPKARRAPGRMSSMLLLLRLLDWSSWTVFGDRGAEGAGVSIDGWPKMFAFATSFFLLPLTPRLLRRWACLISQSVSLGFLARLFRNRLKSCLFMLLLIWCRMNLKKIVKICKASFWRDMTCSYQSPWELLLKKDFRASISWLSLK